MDLAMKYPEIAIKIASGLFVAILTAFALTLVGRRAPVVRVRAALLFGMGLGVAVVRLADEIRQRGLDDQVLLAAGRGDVGALRTALDKGGSVMADESTSGGIPALYYALRNGDPACVEFLLRRGADPSYAGWTEESSLSMAKKEKRADLAALLRRYGAR